MDRVEAAPWIAANKFGQGMRAGEREEIARDPKAWLKKQLPLASVVPASLRDISASATLLIEERQLQQDINALQKQQTRPGAKEELREAKGKIARRSTAQLQARLQAAIATDTPFVERLVRFWSNHFTVAAGGGVKQTLRHIAVPFENEAIRHSLNHSFGDMLLAVEQHPAMLIYLDNVSSVGPDSKAGKVRKLGLNENLAREIMELHTLGVDGGYSQQDVTAFARVITGWGVDLRGKTPPESLGESVPGTYRFTLSRHQPGVQKVLGKSYAGVGEQQGKEVLRDLAIHPATARHLARKLVQHFVADDPPEDSVASIARVFLDTGGWLPAVHAALVDLEQAWDPALRKLKTPEDYVVSVARACGLPETAEKPALATRALNQALQTFAQAPFTAGSPAGWPDAAELWGTPDALLKRIEWVNALIRYIPTGLDPLALRSAVLPHSPELWQEIDRAESSGQALALLLAGPQFQWRGV